MDKQKNKEGGKMKALRDIIHPATESPGERAIYLFFLDPRSSTPTSVEWTRFLSPDVTPSTVAWKIGEYQKLALFWIYEDDFLNAIEYSEWAKEFENKAAYDACFAFPDYKECKASNTGKKVNNTKKKSK